MEPASLRAILAGTMTQLKTHARLTGYALALLTAVACGSDPEPAKMASSSPLQPNNGATETNATGPAQENTPDAPARGQPGAGEGSNPGSLSPGNSQDPAPGAAGSDGATPAQMPAGGGAAGETSTPPASPFPSSVQRPQIMIVGDSISAGPGCYKKYLLMDLMSNGITNFDFVGEYTDDCGGGVRHSARSCSTAEQYTQPTFTLAAGSCNPSGTFPGLAQLVAKYPTDLLMIQLGVNDTWGARSTDAILANYATLVQQARAQNPNIVIAIAQIQQIRPMSDGDAVFARAQQLINAIPAWAQAQSQPQSPVFVADLWTNSDTAQTLDGVHPNDEGAQRMGLNWFNALKAILPAN
jgi:hypothetical protein